jgi:hypothetical protein
LEQAYRSALAHHVHWPARLGSPMLISETWYKRDSISNISYISISTY